MTSIFGLLHLPIVAAFAASPLCPPESDAASARAVQLVNLGDLGPETVVVTSDDHDKKVVKKSARMMVVVRDDNGEWRIEEVDGNAKVLHDGKELHDVHVEHDGGRVIIKMPDGEKVIELDELGRANMVWEAADAGEAPKGQIGVVMGELDPALREHLGIDDEGAFIITQVMPGLSADRAGVKAKDVVIRIDGKSASMERLHDLVGSGKPGQSIKLRVLRKGQPQDVVVKIEKAKNVIQFDTRSSSDSDSDSDHEFHWTFDMDSDHDADHKFDFDFGNDFDFRFEGIEGMDADALRKKLHKHLIERAINLDAIKNKVKEFHFDPDTLKKLRLRVDDFAGDPEMWMDVHEHVMDALKNSHIDNEELHSHIEKALKDGIGEWRMRLHPDGGDTEHDVFFEMLPGDDDENVIILEDGNIAKWTTKKPATVKPQKTGDLEDRLARLEDRLAHLEAMLEKLASHLSDDRR